MATFRTVLFYAFAPVADPAAVRLWQRELAGRWNLTGRVIVAPHGINATLGGRVEDLKQYVKGTRQYPGFEGIDVKWAAGTGEDFPRLSVKVRAELVAFGAPEAVRLGPEGIVGGGTRLDADGLDALVAERGEDVVMLDGRNAYEASIGRFRGAFVPDVVTSRDFVGEITSGSWDHLKDRPVVTYCTGGVRCEVLSVMLKDRGFSDVYQMDGGVVRYLEARGSKGLWDGSLYVFDGRGHVAAAGAEPLGECERCGGRTARFENCADAACRTERLVCDRCAPLSATERCHVCVDEGPERWRSRVAQPGAQPVA
ncbi:oxygen-dependent tRNA uridine(34) hydroxylase TrhO [Sanguibacter sp. A247]|uniref:oxygen-dependent tRNA uridine(34) hydroxylase TrhO n=1 Tax=unclassified Sanguibacter TaxID=2645534 RepID=UPI003FD76237